MTQQPDALRLADALRVLHEAKKYYPSGASGQMCGMEQYRLVATGWAFEDLQEAAAELRRLHEDYEHLRRESLKAVQVWADTKQEVWKLKAINAQLLEALEEVSHRLEAARIWGGMDWHYNPLHPRHYLPARDKARAAIAAAKELK